MKAIIPEGYKKTKVGIIPEDWNIVKLGDIAKFLKGKGISKNDLSNGGNPCIRYGELYTTYKEQILEVFSTTNLDTKDLVLSKFNDIIIPSSGETAIDIATASCVLLDNIVLGGDLNIIRHNENGIFLSYYLNIVAKQRIALLAQGVSIVHLYISDLKTLQISLPPLKEQQKIAEILTTWDEAITKQQQLIKEKEQLKKGLMQNLLSGKVRFSGFSDKWQEVKLGNIAKKMQSGGTPKADNQEFYNGNISFVRINDITSSEKYLTKTESTITEKGLKNSSTWIVPINSIIYSMYASVGFLSINKIEVATSQAMINIILDLEKANLEYIYYYLLDFKKNVHIYIETGTQGNLNAKTIKNFKIFLPSILEQQKIAEVLSLADSEINLLKNELEELKLQKKALMQKLLTGQVRVKI